MSYCVLVVVGSGGSIAGMTELFDFIDEVKGYRNYLLVLSVW